MALYCVQCKEGEMGGAGSDSHEPVVTVYIEDNIWDLMQWMNDSHRGYFHTVVVEEQNCFDYQTFRQNTSSDGSHGGSSRIRDHHFPSVTRSPLELLSYCEDDRELGSYWLTLNKSLWPGVRLVLMLSSGGILSLPVMQTRREMRMTNIE